MLRACKESNSALDQQEVQARFDHKRCSEERGRSKKHCLYFLLLSEKQEIASVIQADLLVQERDKEDY